MAPQLPKPVLPRTEVMTKSPIDGLKEIRTSLSSTLESVEAALPAAPALPGASPLAGLKLPRVEEFIKGPKAGLAEIEGTLPFKPPVALSKVAPEMSSGGFQSRETETKTETERTTAGFNIRR